MKTIHKKIISFFLILAISSFFSPVKVLAGTDDWPSAAPDAGSQMLDGILKKFGIDSKVIAKTVKKANTIEKKMKGPTVTIAFSPTSPNPGEKVTATASAINFGNEAGKMYYTWYLRHKGEEETEKNGKTAAIEKYKTRAMRIIASNDFEGSDEADSDKDEYDAPLGGDDQRNVGDQEEGPHCFFRDTESGSDYEFQECRHLFPNADASIDTGNKSLDDKFKECAGANAKEETASGADNTFGKCEEIFWQTDPTDSDTADTGHTDEANVAGLGMESFTWTFQEGDEVGVAVEGISFTATDYDDASYKVMWALVNNKCELIDDAFADSDEAGTGGSCPTSCGPVSAGGYTYTPMAWGEYCAITVLHGEGNCNDGAQDQYFWENTSEIQDLFATTYPDCLGYENRISECYGANIAGVGCGTTGCGSLILAMTGTHADDTGEGDFQMTLDDLNKCLLQNFTDPAEGGKSKKIDVSLSYTPTNPINDPDGNNSDELTVNSVISDAKDSEFLYYKWEVFSISSETIPDESNNDAWGDALSKETLYDVGETMGLGLKNFKFKLKFKDENTTYLKVKLSVSENAYNGERKGQSYVVVPISSNATSLKIYDANISDSLALSKGKQKCLQDNSEINEPACQVAKNQILAIEANDPNLTDFLWQISGGSFAYKYNKDGNASNPAYFPIAKETGETFTVSLSALNKETGEKVNLSQSFKVVDPKITIKSEDESSAVSSLLGFYTDTDNVSWPDYSETEFETLEGSTMKLKAEFTAATPPDDKIEWYIDGSLYGTGDSLSLSADKSTGSSYSITVNALYSQDNNTAKALSKYWDISYDGLYEKDLTASITASTVGSISEDTAKNNVKKFLASLASGVPSYLSFLFRIVLTTGLILFAFRVIFVLLPKARREEI